MMELFHQDDAAVTPERYGKQLKLQKRAIELLRLSESSYIGCRDQEATTLKEFIESSSKKGYGGSIFVFGLSGTGKTTTVNHVLNQYKENNADSRVVSITASGFISWWNVVETLAERVLGAEQSKKLMAKLSHIKLKVGGFLCYKKTVLLMSQIFETPDKYTVCLMDEADYLRSYLISKDRHSCSNWMLQAIFEAANSRRSKTLFIAISNNLELATMITEKLCRVLMFKPYDEKQMISIIKGKLGQLDDTYTSVINDTAILLLVRRVANTSGDLRACLDTFTRAISNSMSNLEDKIESLSSVSTTDSLFTTPESSPDRYSDECSTPKRTFTEMTISSLELKEYQVGHKEVGSLTPTLTLSKTALLKQKIAPLPLMQLLTLLGIAKSTIEENDTVVSLNSVKRSLIHLADALSMPNTEVENFYATGFKDAIDIFKELQIISDFNERRFDGDDVIHEECIALSIDGEALAQIVLPMSPAFVGLNLEFSIDEDYGYQYSKIPRSFAIKTGIKRARRKQW